VLAVLLVTAIVHHVYTTATNSDAGAAYALCLRLETMALFVSMGWGGCAQTFAGMCLGAGMHDRAARAGWIAMLYNAITMAVLAVLYRTLGADMLDVFTKSPRILARAVEYLGTVGPSYVFYGVAIVLGNAVIGAGATRLALRVDAFLVGLVQTPLLLLVAAVFVSPITTLWFALVAVNVINAALYIWVFRRRALWQQNTLVRAP
jgi:Na+-driven multidrug efflux pump